MRPVPVTRALCPSWGSERATLSASCPEVTGPALNGSIVSSVRFVQQFKKIARTARYLV